MTILNLVIASESDDGHDSSSAWDDRDSPYSHSEFFRVVNVSGTEFRGALRFINVTIPNAENINSATLTLRRNGGGKTLPTSITVYGDDVDNAPVWGAASRPQSGFTNTTASAVNSSLPSTDIDFTFDVTTIVKELVDRGGWSSGNAMRFQLICGGTYNGLYVTDYDLSPTDTTATAARLDIDYGAPGITIDTPPATILRVTQFDVVISNASASVGAATLTLNGESCSIDIWPGTSGTLKATFDGDALYDEVTGYDLVLTDDDATTDTATGIDFTPTALNNYINLVLPVDIDDGYADYHYPASSATGWQWEWVTLTAPSSKTITGNSDSGMILSSASTVNENADMWMINTSGVRSASFNVIFQFVAGAGGGAGSASLSLSLHLGL